MNAAAVKSTYARYLTDLVSVRRYTGTATNRPRFDAEHIHARVTGYQPHELVGSIVQGDRKVIVSVEDLIAKKFTLPLTTNDKLVVEGKELSIIVVDGETRKIDGILIAYELQVRG